MHYSKIDTLNNTNHVFHGDKLKANDVYLQEAWFQCWRDVDKSSIKYKEINWSEKQFTERTVDGKNSWSQKQLIRKLIGTTFL